jgi:hypothetical protein
VYTTGKVCAVVTVIQDAVLLSAFRLTNITAVLICQYHDSLLRYQACAGAGRWRQALRLFDIIEQDPEVMHASLLCLLLQ